MGTFSCSNYLENHQKVFIHFNISGSTSYCSLDVCVDKATEFNDLLTHLFRSGLIHSTVPNIKLSCLSHSESERTAYCCSQMQLTSMLWMSVPMFLLSACASNMYMIDIQIEGEELPTMLVDFLQSKFFFNVSKPAQRVFSEISGIILSLEMNRMHLSEDMKCKLSRLPRYYRDLLGNVNYPTLNTHLVHQLLYIRRSLVFDALPSEIPLSQLHHQISTFNLKTRYRVAEDNYLSISLQCREIYESITEIQRRVRAVESGESSSDDFEDDIHCSSYSNPEYVSLLGFDLSMHIPAWVCAKRKESLSLDQIAHLPRSLITPGSGTYLGAFRSESCSICLCMWKPWDQVVFLPCHHVFHDNCLSTWLQRSCKCPLDNKNILKLISR